MKYIRVENINFPTETGYKIATSVQISNQVYLNIDKSTYKLFEESGIVCEIKSVVPEKSIRDSDELVFETGKFYDYKEAKEYCDKIEKTIRFYLSMSQCVYVLKSRIIDLSAFGESLECSAMIGCRRPLEWRGILDIDTERMKNVLMMLERAERAADTPVGFSLYVFVLESLLDSNESKRSKSTEMLSVIDALEEYIRHFDCENTIKDSLLNYIDKFRMQGSRNAVKKSINEICKDRKNLYNEIYNKSYDFRNLFIHQGIVHSDMEMYFSSLREMTYEIVYRFLKKTESIPK